VRGHTEVKVIPHGQHDLCHLKARVHRGNEVGNAAVTLRSVKHDFEA
jgi:hypothetical protein